MQRYLMIAGIAVAAGLITPAVADARDACQQRNHDRKVTGTVLGAVGGALVGNAVSDGGGGAVVGGLAGAAIGNNVARVKCNPERRYSYSRSHSYRDSGRNRQAQYAGCRYEDRAFYDENGRLVRRNVRVCR